MGKSLIHSCTSELTRQGIWLTSVTSKTSQENSRRTCLSSLLASLQGSDSILIAYCDFRRGVSEDSRYRGFTLRFIFQQRFAILFNPAVVRCSCLSIKYRTALKSRKSLLFCVRNLFCSKNFTILFNSLSFRTLSSFLLPWFTTTFPARKNRCISFRSCSSREC